MLQINTVDRLDIGIQKENDARNIYIDMSAWMTDFPNGVISIWHQRNGDATKYAAEGVSFNRETGILTWTPKAQDTFYAGEGYNGRGIAEIRLTEGGVIKKTKDIPTLCARSLMLSPTEEMESGWQNLIDAMGTMQSAAEDAQDAAEAAQEAAEDAQEAAEEAVQHYPFIGEETGTWFVWDAQEGAFVDTEIEAQGPQGETGQAGPKGDAGTPGVPGVSPTVSSAEITGGHRLTITDAQGTTSFNVMDGQDGQDGQDGTDGVSPTVSSAAITGGHRITIVDAQGTTTVDVMDGTDGQDGADGYTPVRGTDYWTAEDKAEIVEDTAEELNAEGTVTTPADMVTFEDGCGWAMDLEIAVEPVQAGSGDPSPTNVRPISGWTKVRVGVTRKNMISNGKDTTNGYISNRYLKADGTDANNSVNYISEYFRVKPGTEYTLSATDQFNLGSICFYTIEKTYISGVAGGNSLPKQITTPSNAYYARCVQYLDTSKITQFEEGSTATTLEHFGASYPISFPVSAGTVYGGKLTVHADGTGTLTLTHGQKTFNGSEDWAQENITGAYRMKLIDATIDCVRYTAAQIPEAISNMYVSKSRNETYLKNTGVSINAGQAYVYDPDYQTNTAFKTFLASNNLTVVYPLATPETYTLTPGQVMALTGKNIIWADCGPVESVRYIRRADMDLIRAYIDGKIAEAIEGLS